MFLVYTNGLRGPEPERWTELLTDTRTGKGRAYLSAYRLTPDEQALPLSVLVKRYPAPEQVG